MDAKALLGDLQSLGFTPILAKPEMGKEVGRRRASKDTCLKKERLRSIVTPKKVGEGLKQRRELNKSRSGWKLAWWGTTKKKKASHLLVLRGKHQY